MDFPPSFRDPSGFCWLSEGHVYRSMNSVAAVAMDNFLSTPVAARFVSEKRLVPTRKLTHAEHESFRNTVEEGNVIYEHERIPFLNFPYEWPPEMLHAAGLLTAELAVKTLSDGYSLKDASPYNVLFRGSQPVFIDVPSFERRVPGDPVWKPYAQFVRTFLLPLLANRTWGLPLADIFVNHRDGVEPETIYRWCSPIRRLLPPFLGCVTLPTWLSGKGDQAEAFRERRLSDEDKARFILEMMFKGLSTTLAKVKPIQGNASKWSEYMAMHSYNDADFMLKESFVQTALGEAKPTRVLDIGANTGHFSALAASVGASVVAIDADVRCVGGIWKHAREQKLDILPLVVDFARPSPALGWRNRECASFMDRARGSFDVVLMLAVLHHFLVTERVPLDDVLSLTAELTTSYVLLEFVAPEDPMFRHIARGRDHLHADLNTAVFERACKKHFEIVRSTRVGVGHRWLYWLRKRGTSS